jgi:hypothetical protein
VMLSSEKVGPRPCIPGQMASNGQSSAINPWHARHEHGMFAK